MGDGRAEKGEQTRVPEMNSGPDSAFTRCHLDLGPWEGHSICCLPGQATCLPPCHQQGRRSARPLRPSQKLCPHPHPCQSYATHTTHFHPLPCYVSTPVQPPSPVWQESPMAPREGAQTRLRVTDATCLSEMFPALITFLNSTNTISAQ